jgi:hypothetical protein
VWQRRRRLRRLEAEVAEARKAQADLQRRVEFFEKIAEAAGASLDGPVDALPGPAAAGPATPVPASLLAAASDPRRGGVPVRVAVDGSEVIAVIASEGGDPGEWWTAIRRLAARPGAVS